MDDTQAAFRAAADAMGDRRLSIRLGAELYVAISVAAAREHRSVSNWVLAVLRAKLEGETC